MSAMLHDVGKVAISDNILKKPDRFTPEEFQVMKLHTLFGANLFADIYSDFDESAAIVAISHHEHWDENEVLENIRGEAGKQFDPELVEIFLENIDTFRQIEKLYPDHAE
jgi:response regulator RpfG family c-di-GMP phosphodiesterase